MQRLFMCFFFLLAAYSSNSAMAETTDASNAAAAQAAMDNAFKQKPSTSGALPRKKPTEKKLKVGENSSFTTVDTIPKPEVAPVKKTIKVRYKSHNDKLVPEQTDMVREYQTGNDTVQSKPN